MDLDQEWDMLKSRVCLLIREWRKRKGIKLAELAKRTGIDPTQLCKYERGEAEPGLLRLRRISQALQVPIEALYPHETGGAPPRDVVPRRDVTHA